MTVPTQVFDCTFDERGTLMKSDAATDVFVLGAGFSRAVSGLMPLTDELGRASLARAGLGPIERFDGGTFETWLSTLAEPQPYLSAAENSANRSTFDRLVEAIHAVMSEIEYSVVDAGLPAWLSRFVLTMHARRATVITFNYDRLIERVLGSANVADLERGTGDDRIQWSSCLHDLPGFPPLPPRWGGGESHRTLRLLKLHGSLNWFWVPGDESGATLSHWELDDDHNRRRFLPGREPFIVPPAAAKSAFFQNPVVSELWKQSAKALTNSYRVSLVGYSLPLTDLMSAALISKTLSGRRDLEVSVVNKYPAAVSRSLKLVSGLDAHVERSVDRAVARYVTLASIELAQGLAAAAPLLSLDSLILVGWSKEVLAPAIGVRRIGATVELLVADFDDPHPFSQVEGRPLPISAREVVEFVQPGDRLVARLANGRQTTLVGIDRLRTQHGVSANWQLLMPADCSAELLRTTSSRLGSE